MILSQNPKTTGVSTLSPSLPLLGTESRETLEPLHQETGTNMALIAKTKTLQKHQMYTDWTNDKWWCIKWNIIP